MPEYVTFEMETTDDPDVRLLYINQTLTEEPEIYPTAEEGALGSPIAQLLCIDIEGIAALTIQPDHLIITRQPDMDWTMLIDDVRDALRDFYL
ncbi:NifU N-terminal domain-containing protein [Phototrophicus methaneseepsis]|uniref:NifU N-terminal domain-containing protein n=1 Tax=Phototrophicus methaneseepsis TaxID=2710758 RepID=A0A7S8E9F2_9CHLR|nr:NifU N-terminal domain-containing protein [Phototrophicus methaneseepsis]QPC82790.1 NifU N-terminal domain-containing protein [Phototrophicus methaneseepsis]